jgi:hypothetical protein
MGQTFQRAQKTRKEADGWADLRRDIIGKQTKNISKHRNAVYQYLDSDDDDDDDFPDENGWDDHAK